MDAGSGALVHNAPLGSRRCRDLVEVGVDDADTLVDLGCGRGGFVLTAAESSQQLTAIGVDTDAAAVEAAAAEARRRGLEDRTRFETGDAAAWVGRADVAACIGASHALGGAAPLLGHLAAIPGIRRAIVGDAVWERPPDEWHLEVFGELPTLPELQASAGAAGWTVAQCDSSTLTEWDAFENGWIDGVRAVGTPEADAFASERAAEYQRYRGVLGFAWLVLDRKD